MKLYYSPGACSLSPHIVALEAGIPLEIEKVDLRAKKTESGKDFWTISPRGYVPALDLGNGQVLTEGPAIVQYLADHKPEAGLAPANGTMERYRLQETLNFTTSELHKSIGSLFNPACKDAWREGVLAYADRRIGQLDKMLEGKQFVFGNGFSVADAYLFTVLNWTRIHKIDMSKYPNVDAYMQRIGARPKVKEAMKAEGIGG